MTYFSKKYDSPVEREANITRLKEALADADAVVLGAGAGLSTSAGFVYNGERFTKTFSDFEARYDFHDMYTGGFYPYQTLEEHWAYWSRNIMVNRYAGIPKPVYDQLLRLVAHKDYFVITTNVDHCFQRAGFDKSRLFYTQGDYGLFQCSEPCCQKTYDNEAQVRAMIAAQNMTADCTVTIDTKMTIPTELVPHCPVCGKPMSMNLRADDTFVQDEGWYKAAGRYEDFLNDHAGQKILFLELGVGGNTPGIIKYPFWQMTAQNPQATYACLNFGEAVCPQNIARRSICINGDIGEILAELGA